MKRGGIASGERQKSISWTAGPSAGITGIVASGRIHRCCPLHDIAAGVPQPPSSLRCPVGVGSPVRPKPRSEGMRISDTPGWGRSLIFVSSLQFRRELLDAHEQARIERDEKMSEIVTSPT